CSAAVSQFAALAAITGPRDPVTEAHALLDSRRRSAFAALDRAGIRYARGAAGPYVLIDSSHVERTGRPLTQRVSEQTGVVLTPGSAFGLPSWLRLSLTQP